MKKVNIETQYRTLDIRSGNIDKEERTVELSFSSEEPVSRYFGTEILDHKASSVDLSRLNNKAAVLEDHQGGQIGVVLGAKIKDGKGMAKVKFSQVGRGAEVWQDIVDGIRSNISFGYQVRNLTLEEENEGEDPIYRSMDWMPFEISVVGVPADATIGIGRSKENVSEIEVDDSFRGLEIEDVIVPKEIKSEKLKEQRLKLLSLKINKKMSKH